MNLIFGSHNLRIESNGKKAEKQVEVIQGGLTKYSIDIASNYTETASGLNVEMVFVEGGTFQTGGNDGNSNEKPLHSVTLSDFLIGKYEVTQKQWLAVMDNNPSSNSGCDNCPVEQISWNDTQIFVQKLNQKTKKTFRLPTEAEWEYAAKGGNKSKGYPYSGSNSVGDVAWYAGNAGAKTHPVGQKQANELGLYDMSGNVWEWCSDLIVYSPNPPSVSPSSYGVYHGGSCINIAELCRPSSRINFKPDNRNNGVLGFRLVLVP